MPEADFVSVGPSAVYIRGFWFLNGAAASLCTCAGKLRFHLRSWRI